MLELINCENSKEGENTCFNSPEKDELLKFAWNSRWLKGDEYHYILTHADQYIKSDFFSKYPPKVHPPTIYNNPIGKLNRQLDGEIYFVEGLSVGSEFGFPRIDIHKEYKW